ncbi:hypothetical protein M2444_004915 [Paenibacillus sp. PastF-3]|nr:hypothetical protein [Paenibacillus sp. PastF-3]
MYPYWGFRYSTQGIPYIIPNQVPTFLTRRVVTMGTTCCMDQNGYH